jgi:hypothetical protein
MGGISKGTRTVAIGTALGVALAIGVPMGVDGLRNWIGQIVLQAVHYHWQWERQQEQGILQMLNQTPASRPEA